MSLHGCTAGLFLVMISFGINLVQAQESDPAHKEAEAAYVGGDFAKCIELTTKLLTENPKDSAALHMRASARVELGIVRRDIKELRLGIEDARESLRHGVTEPNYYLPYMYGMTSLANLENRKEHADVVLQVAKSVLAKPALTPEQRANVLFQRAGAYVFLKNFDEAGNDYREAIKADPTHLGSHVGLAESYVVSGQPDKALAAFTSAVDSFANNPLVFNNRGLFLQQQGRYKEAIADFNKALQLDPKYAVAYANRGFTFQADKNLPLAEADYSEAIKLDPRHPLFYSLRGTCRLSQLNTEGAIEDYNQAIRLDPQNPVAQADLGFARYFSRDYAAASQAFDQSLALSPAMRYLNPWRCWSLALQGRVESAAPIVEQSSRKPEGERDWIDQLVLFINGKISEQELVKSIDKVTEPRLKNAQLCEAYYFIAERRHQLGDKSNAAIFHQQALKTNAADLSAYRGAQFALRANAN